MFDRGFRAGWSRALLAVSLVAIGLTVALRQARSGTVAAGGQERGSPAANIVWADPVEVASGEAHRGAWRMNRSDFRYVDGPTPAVDDHGRVGVAWVDQSRKAVLFQLYGPGGEARLQEPTDVSRSPDIFSWLPRVVITSDDPARVYLLWQEIVFSGGSHGGEIFFARSTDGGEGFSDPLNLSNTPAGAGKGRLGRDRWDNGSLDLALAPNGDLLAAWTEYEGPLRVARSTDGGRSFSEPVEVGGGRGELPARGPSLAVGPGGRVHLAWTVGDDPGADIRVAASDDGGRSFGPVQVVVPGEGRADAPKVAVGPDGAVHLLFMETPRGARAQPLVRYARRPAGREGFEGVVEFSGPRADEGAGFGHLALDGAGNPFVLWELFPDPRRRPEGLALAASFDRGASFGSPSVVPGTRAPELGFNGGLEGLLTSKLAVNAAGQVAVVNASFHPGGGSRVRLLLGKVTGR